MNKSKCLLTEKWIKKTYFIHMHTYAYTMEYYSDIKKKENLRQMDGPLGHHVKLNNSKRER